MVFKHTKYPNAAKDYLRFMMEAGAVRPVADRLPRLLGASAQGLRQEQGLEQRPEARGLPRQMDNQFWDGYKGPISQAAGAVAADYIDGADVRLGRVRPGDAARTRPRRRSAAPKRYYR